MYQQFISYEAMSSTVAEFSWDLKFAGAQVLLSEVENLKLQVSLIKENLMKTRFDIDY